MHKKKSNIRGQYGESLMLGEYLGTLRRRCGLSRDRVAEYLNRNPSAITQIENDKPAHKLAPYELFAHLELCSKEGDLHVSNADLLWCLSKLNPPVTEDWRHAYIKNKGFMGLNEQWRQAHGKPVEQLGLYIKALLAKAEFSESRLSPEELIKSDCLGTTQTDLARYCKIPIATCSSIIKGARPLDLDVAKIMKHFFTDKTVLKEIFDPVKFDELVKLHRAVRPNLKAVTPDSMSIGVIVPPSPSQHPKL